VACLDPQLREDLRTMTFETEASLIRQEVDAILRQVGGGEFVEIVRRPLAEPGKVLHQESYSRWSLLPLLVCEGICGYCDHAVPAAAAMEFFVAAGDVFDDIEDQDSGDALWCSYGLAQAANAATALLMLTQHAVARLIGRVEPSAVVSVMETISSTGLKACSGQYLDLMDDAQEVSEEMYFHMVELKSASLLECACRIGALLAASDERVITSCSLFGRNLGMAAQIVNDIQSVRANSGAKSDIRGRKRTLPAIFGLTHAEGDDLKTLTDIYLKKVPVTPEREENVRGVLMRSGAIHYALVAAELYRQRALKALEQTSITGPALQRLKVLAGL
jgi:geranylgeranyl diphosphate synthase type I